MTKSVWRAAAIGLALIIAGSAAFAEDAAEEAPRIGPPYAAIKATMQRLYDNGDREIRSPLGKGDYDLYHCRHGSEYLGNSADDDTTNSYANIAFDIIVWTNNLKKLSYPAALWQAPIGEYEAGETKRVADSPLDSWSEWTERRAQFLRALAEKLEAHRKTKRSLRKIVVEGGCGAGELSVTIATEPKGGQVLFIPTFFHELCKVQKLNPDDTAVCTRWREAVDGSLSQVSGDYLYQVKWPDGTTRKGKLSFNKLEEGQTVTLRKP